MKAWPGVSQRCRGKAHARVGSKEKTDGTHKNSKFKTRPLNLRQAVLSVQL